MSDEFWSQMHCNLEAGIKILHGPRDRLQPQVMRANRLIDDMVCVCKLQPGNRAS